MTTPILIDGSKGEGGGQILRNAISYATILGKEIQVEKIRAGRSQSGLKAQHMTGLLLAANICGGTLSGAAKGSTTIHYVPGSGDGAVNESAEIERTLTSDIGTAGSICLLLQAAVPCVLFGVAAAPHRLVLKGGTNAAMAPQYDYCERVFWPTLRDCCGLSADQVALEAVRRGYFPRGGGEVHARINPITEPLKPLNLIDRGEVIEIVIRSFHAGKLPRHLAQDMAKSAKAHISKHLPQQFSNWKMEIVTEKSAVGSGSGILIVATTSTGCLLAGSALGSPKKKAKAIGLEAATELVNALDDGGCVDEWLQDQLILYMALAQGQSEMLTGSLTLHTQTAIMIAEQLSGATFQVEKVDSSAAAEPSASDNAAYGSQGRIPGKHIIRCQGIGYQHPTSSE